MCFEKPTAKIWVCALFSVVIVGFLMEHLATASTDAEHEKRARALMRRRLDFEVIAALDTDGDQKLDRTEYVLGMLTAAGVLTEEDWKPWMERFDELDITRTGVLDRSDFRDSATDLAVETE